MQISCCSGDTNPSRIIQGWFLRKSTPSIPMGRGAEIWFLFTITSLKHNTSCNMQTGKYSQEYYIRVLVPHAKWQSVIIPRRQAMKCLRCGSS